MPFSRSIFSTIRLASATASEIAATYAGEFLGAVANFLAAKIDAHTAMIADLRGSSTGQPYHFRFLFAILQWWAMSRNAEKKAAELRALNAARIAGVPIPLGEIPGEEPDFRFDADSLGIEVSELLRPASGNSGIVPAAEATFHAQVVQLAQEQYYRVSRAEPVKVVLFFTNAHGKKRDKQALVQVLVEFVRANTHRARPYTGFERSEVPEGFGHIGISAESGDWICTEGGSFTVSDIQQALASSIVAKNKLVPAYRKNLAPGAQIWLLLYSTASISRGMPIPHGIDKWQFDFDFDRVFWFVALGNEFVEIQRRPCSNSNKS